MYKYLKKNGSLVKGEKGVPLAVKVPENVIRSSENPTNAEDYNEGTVWVKDTEKAWVKRKVEHITHGQRILTYPYFMSFVTAVEPYDAPISIGMLRKIYGNDLVDQFIANVIIPLYGNINTEVLEKEIKDMLQTQQDLETWYKRVSAHSLCVILEFLDADYDKTLPSFTYDYITFIYNKEYKCRLDSATNESYLHGQDGNFMLLIPGLFEMGNPDDLKELNISRIMYNGNTSITDTCVLGYLAISLSDNFNSAFDIVVQENGSMANALFISDQGIIKEELMSLENCGERMWFALSTSAIQSDFLKTILVYMFGGQNYQQTLDFVGEASDTDTVLNGIIDSRSHDYFGFMPAGGELQIEPDTVTYTHEWLD